MVKQRKKINKKRHNGKGFKTNSARARKIDASTVFETCTEQLSPFGGLLALIKFFDLIGFKDIFDFCYIRPQRDPKLGHYLMFVGILMLLFIGFNRLWHFTYIQLDAMLCGFFRLTRLPVASTFWRYVDSLGINQANSLLKMMSILRERIWQLCGINYRKIHLDIDTTVETVFGNQQGGRKGHNTKYRGKKGLRPILCFIQETREYLVGKLRTGKTISGTEAAAFIKKIKNHLPGCVQQVLLRADGEFLSGQSIAACIEAGFEFIIANKLCDPPFEPQGWYRPFKRKAFEYNSCVYQPMGWKAACRFVVMRIANEKAKKSGQPTQCALFEAERYIYRVFCTNLSGPAHKIIATYDKRADVENLIGEAKREGLDAIPSAKFKTNYAFFQIVMLAYNIWRYLKMIAQQCSGGDKCTKADHGLQTLQGIMNNTIRIARLKLLFIAAKVVKESNRHKVKYSIADARTQAMLNFLNFLDTKRSNPKPWEVNSGWPQRLGLQTS
jgi:hypothetical protein